MGRFRLALAVSVCAHLLLTAGVATEPAHRNARPTEQALPLSARLGLPPASLPVVASEETWKPVRPRLTGEEPATSEQAERSSRTILQRAQETAAPLALPQTPDVTVYTARDLDSYPRLLAPLDFESLFARSGQPSGALRFELTIDEHGVVHQVVFAEPVPAGVPESDWHALVAAARFMPARKDGRAVKSRVLLSVDMAAARHER